jgi:acylphosphatase
VNCSKRVVYTGRVQGVGFRFTTQHLAKAFPIGGYVRNQADGTVEVVVEGATDVVDGFLAAVAVKMAEYVTETTVEDREPEGLNRFQIRY